MITKLLILFIVFAGTIFIGRLKTKYDDCCSYMEDVGVAVFGMCSGMIGGTEETDYTSEKCIDCPYYVGNKGASCIIQI